MVDFYRTVRGLHRVRSSIRSTVGIASSQVVARAGGLGKRCIEAPASGGGALKALEVLKKESSPFTANAECALKKLRQAGIEMDVRSHRLKVLLRGHREAILLSISPAEVSQAFSAIQSETPEAPGTAFVVFDSKDERTVISLRAILFCQFLWDANFAVCAQPSAETDGQNVVRIYLGENTVPVELSVDPEDDDDEGENSYVNTAIYLLESGGVEASERIHFCDVDGEDVILRAGDIAMLTVPRWVLDPDERIYDDDLDEDDEGPTPMPAEDGAGQPIGAHPGALS